MPYAVTTPSPFVILLANVIWLIKLALFIWIILSVLISFNIVNRWHPVVSKVFDVLNRLLEPMLAPIRRFMPELNGIDLSPVVLILVLEFLRNALYHYF